MRPDEVGVQMRQIRGIMLNAWLSFLKEKYGEDKVLAAIKALPQEDKIHLEKSVLDASWYPVEMTRVLGKVQSAVAGRDEFAEELGSYMAHYAFSGAYKVFLTNDPLTQAKKIMSVSEYFYRNVHKLEIEGTSPTSCVVRYRTSQGRPSAITCRNRRGWWTRTLEMAGGKNVKVVHPECMASGKEYCEFHINWELA